MSSPAELVESFLIGIVLVMVGMVLLLAVAVPWGIMDPLFVSAGFENVPAQWNTFDDRDYLVDLIHVVSYALFILAPLQFIFVAVRKQEYDVYNGGR